MGTRALGANIVNAVVGAGIFVIPGIVAAQLGSAAIFAYLACAVVVALVFLRFAEVGGRVIRGGGAYAYIEDALWRRIKLTEGDFCFRTRWSSAERSGESASDISDSLCRGYFALRRLSALSL